MEGGPRGPCGRSWADLTTGLIWRGEQSSPGTPQAHLPHAHPLPLCTRICLYLPPLGPCCQPPPDPLSPACISGPAGVVLGSPRGGGAPSQARHVRHVCGACVAAWEEALPLGVGRELPLHPPPLHPPPLPQPPLAPLLLLWSLRERAISFIGGDRRGRPDDPVRTQGTVPRASWAQAPVLSRSPADPIHAAGRSSCGSIRREGGPESRGSVLAFIF